ncbi:AP-4 complex accessory subunit tepsin-like [Salvelinus namaycush]|uniref:AP-4 complex accessory subunit tepsin-like n=1 Tax=Salvelinus namaycush TaxID=8040 RepID=A0A8U0TWK1_SALNM|nr:AP-4 complex accessory subunit tepsin-like [Salvelinus namaycush]
MHLIPLPFPSFLSFQVLKIFVHTAVTVHLCGHGSPHFLTELRRNSTFIQQASVYSGPPDPIHGIALYQKVRATAQDIVRLLFSGTASPQSSKLAMPNMGEYIILLLFHVLHVYLTFTC